MKIARLLAVLAALLSLNAVGAGAASATTVDGCQGQLMTLRDDTLAAQTVFTGQEGVGGLVAKLDAASRSSLPARRPTPSGSWSTSRPR